MVVSLGRNLTLLKKDEDEKENEPLILLSKNSFLVLIPSHTTAPIKRHLRGARVNLSQTGPIF